MIETEHRLKLFREGDEYLVYEPHLCEPIGRGASEGEAFHRASVWLFHQNVLAASAVSMKGATVLSGVTSSGKRQLSASPSAAPKTE